jgi:dihydrofolate reductase
VGKIVSSFFISLDGVVEAPDQWHFPYFNDEMGGAIGKAAETTDAFLMGRVVYEEWAGYWPTSTDEPFASFLNNTPKYVVSRTLQEATWNNTTVINGDVAAGIRDLKDRTQRDIGMSGSATLVRWLLANGLLDRLNLLDVITAAGPSVCCAVVSVCIWAGPPACPRRLPPRTCR